MRDRLRCSTSHWQGPAGGLGPQFQMSPGCLLLEVVQARLTRSRHQGKARTHSRVYVSGLSHGPSRLSREVTQAGDVWMSLLRVLPGDSTPNNVAEEVTSVIYSEKNCNCNAICS